MLVLAGGLAGFAAGAGRGINAEGVVHNGFKVGRLNVESWGQD
jgi:hypothetical protein